MGNFGERCSSCNFDGKFPRGREPQIGGAEKKVCIRTLLLCIGGWNGKWKNCVGPKREKGCAKTSISHKGCFSEQDLLQLQDLDTSLGGRS